MPDLSKLNEREVAELGKLQKAFLSARDAKDFSLSDKLRDELARAGFSSPDYSLWHPVMEHPDSRVNRAASRYMYGEP